MRRDADLAGLLDKQEIYEVLMRYCRGVDRADEALIRSCYQEDASDHHGVYVGDAAGFARWAIEHVATMAGTMHCISNVSIWLAGSSALSESYCMAYHRIPSRHGGFTDQPGGVRYVDRFERREGGPWLIAERVVVWDWNRVDPLHREWHLDEGFVRGRRDRDDPVFALSRELERDLSGALDQREC